MENEMLGRYGHAFMKWTERHELSIAVCFFPKVQYSAARQRCKFHAIQ